MVNGIVRNHQICAVLLIDKKCVETIGYPRNGYHRVGVRNNAHDDGADGRVIVGDMTCWAAPHHSHTVFKLRIIVSFTLT
jgi:hypothetical protein